MSMQALGPGESTRFEGCFSRVERERRLRRGGAILLQNRRAKFLSMCGPVNKFQLKAEQAEADAAREAAWSQLKSVVADIARLAAPDAVIKAGTPTASAPAGFGAA